MHSFQFVFEAIGTKWIIDIIDAPAAISQKDIEIMVKQRIDTFDKVYSRFREDSLIMQMSSKAGLYTLPDDMFPIINLYHKLYQLTDGAFTPLIGQVLSDAGYDKDYSLQSKVLSAPPSWEEVISSYDHNSITIQKPAILDVGAAGKGYLIDIIGALLEEHHIASFCIDAGGDILQKNNINTKLNVGLEHPANLKQVIGVAQINNQAICGSAGNRRKWGQFHHIINPHNLASVDSVLATWVVAKNTMIADALSTCLFLVSSETLKRHYEFEFLIVYPDYSIKRSAHFPAELFYNPNNE